jgi:2-dehydropantoate 2-reductase
MGEQTSILFVGAGAVGQVYARHAQLGGARVGFHVREKYVDEIQSGLKMFQYASRPGKSKPRPAVLSNAQVCTTPEQMAEGDWDIIVLCMSSTALRKPWLEPFLARVKPDATLVVLQPGPRDRAYVAERFPLERTVYGMIGFIAWQGPLDGEQLPQEGLAYWLPPGSPSLFSGPKERLQPLLDAWAKGKLGAKEVDDVGKTSAFPACTLNTYLAGLELEGWSFKALKSSPRLSRVTAAMKEASAVMSATVNAPVPGGLKMVHKPLVFKLAMGLGPCVVPFPLETYLAYHFTKVGDQTRDNLKSYLKLAQDHNISTPGLASLVDELLALDAVASA